MITHITKTPAAESDLDEIWDYIAEDNPEGATSFLRMLDDKLQILARNPHVGRLRPELFSNLRSFVVRNYVIFYQPIENGISIIRIISRFRDIKALF